MSSGENSDDEANIPPAAECDLRCKEFAAITDTNSACAMFYLQDRDWDVQRALNAYFEQNPEEAKKASSASAATPSADSGPTSASNSSGDADPEPHRIRLLSWNTDGIDDANVLTRAKAVAKIILQENPDVVFLQEVVPKTADIYEQRCPQYQVLKAGREGYFCIVMLKNASCTLRDHDLIKYFSSTMGRNLLLVKAEVKGVVMQLMTSHLESMASYSDERKRQLQRGFKEMTGAPPETTVIFGGDLNLRDKELAALGGLPEKVYDLWEVTGKRPEAKFTWDTQKNDNKEMNLNYKPRCRFDRLYIRHPTNGTPKLKPVYFELVGIQRLQTCKRFPSDHWGLLTHYDKVKP